MPKTLRFRAIAVGLGLAMLVGLFSLDYTVERGDTLGRIAYEHGVTVADLVAANDIKNANLIRIGQVLIIPGDETAEPVIHVVVRGDTLGRIARSYGTTVSALVVANDIRNANLIHLGQNIVVPEGSSSSSAGSGGSSDPAPATDPTVRTGKYHVIKNGESLARIAAQYPGVTADQLARANGILDGRIRAQWKLFLDGPDFVGGGTGSGDGTYKVKSGDNLAKIAARHGSTISAISSANNITNPNLIWIGQTLTIPNAGSSWVCPTDNASYYNDWGAPRGNGTRFHEGNDLFANRGTPVFAPVSGRVLFKVGSLGGNQFNLIGDDGVTYIGSHLDSFGTDGQVTAGEIVGYVGNTGNASATSPHLHFMMYYKGVVINPFPTLIANGC